MIRRLECSLVRLYPLAFRERYGAEMFALIEDSDPRVRDLVSLFVGALVQHVHPQPLLAESLAPTVRVRTSIRGMLKLTVVFSLVATAFLFTIFSWSRHPAVYESNVLFDLQLFITLSSGLICSMLSAALSSVNRVKDAPPIPQRKVLRRAALLANVAAWTMIAAALSVLLYSITLSIQAPAVADAIGGPFHSNSASISLDFMFLFMFACAVPALISARRIWRAASYS